MAKHAARARRPRGPAPQRAGRPDRAHRVGHPGHPPAADPPAADRQRHHLARVRDAPASRRRIAGPVGWPADLVLCEPPYGLDRDSGYYADGNGYRRDHTLVVPGYIDVAPSECADFTHRWVQAAAAAATTI
jgi:hypothetical protein